MTQPDRARETIARTSATLSRLLRECEAELQEAIPSKRLVLADLQINGSRYLLLKLPSASTRALTRALTKRQLEVALFAADGLSNKEVGRKLAISPATVAAHLRVVYNKLRIDSRTGVFPALLRLGSEGPHGPRAHESGSRAGHRSGLCLPAGEPA